MARRRTRTARGSGDGSAVELRTRDGVAGVVPCGKTLQKSAMEWSYVLQNRRRWADSESSRTEQAARMQRLFEEELGLDAAALKRIAGAGLVEVGVPYLEEAVGWEARVFPWEFAISAATREERGGRPLTVIRRLDHRGERTPAAERELKGLLYVEAVPGTLRGKAISPSERRLVVESLGLGSVPVTFLEFPTLDELRAAVKDVAPEVVHLTGFDCHKRLQGEDRDAGKEVHDGILLRSESGDLEPVPALELARALNAADRGPLLVGCNLAFSAARIASLCVAEGARTAVGFQDDFDASLTELFFADFYRAWADDELAEHPAFRYAWGELREHPKGLAGTGVVLWSARSFREQAGEAAAPPARVTLRRRGRGARAGPGTSAGGRAIEPTRGEGGAHAEPSVAENCSVEVQPLDRLNYSMLHNDQPVFERFVLTRFGDDPIEGVDVLVELHVGADSYPWRRTLDLDKKVVDLRKEIRIPLTSALGRSQRESVRTSLFVEVTHGATVLYRQTHSVTMLPVDEWRDDDENRIWLPSFVLPRDPALLDIVDAGQRFLMALMDDSDVGFGGYQNVDHEAEDPFEGVDRQVQALWAALCFDLPISYINPPPSYGTASQRIRTPSDVMRGKRGTCMDLTLMLAGLCEYVDIYPVVFLLKGHAFPGYWRSDDKHWDFWQVNPPEGTGDGSRGSRSARGQRKAWYFEREHYDEIHDLVDAGEIVPVEATWVTSRDGFWAAIDEGHKNLRSKREFDAMIDVRISRGLDEESVTPLPIQENGA